MGINEAALVTGYSVRHLKRLVDSGRLIGDRGDWPRSWRWVDAEDARLLGVQRNAGLPADQRETARERRRELRGELGMDLEGAELEASS